MPSAAEPSPATDTGHGWPCFTKSCKILAVSVTRGDHVKAYALLSAPFRVDISHLDVLRAGIRRLLPRTLFHPAPRRTSVATGRAAQQRAHTGAACAHGPQQQHCSMAFSVTQRALKSNLVLYFKQTNAYLPSHHHFQSLTLRALRTPQFLLTLHSSNLFFAFLPAWKMDFCPFHSLRKCQHCGAKRLFK